MFSPALSYTQQQTEETSFHPDSENTDPEKRNLPETELVEKTEQPVEYCNIQMRNEIQMNRQKFLSVTQQTVQQSEGECSAYAGTVVFRVHDSRKKFT